MTVGAIGGPPGRVMAGEDDLGPVLSQQGRGAHGPDQGGQVPSSHPDRDIPDPGRLLRAASGAGAGAGRGAQLVLPAVARGVSLSRQLVREICSLLDLDELAEVAELLVSEVVTNAVLHATTESLSVLVQAHHGQLLVSVADSDLQRPSMREPTADSTGGRGLYLLDSLSEHWGVDQWAGGKAVWFTLSAPERGTIDVRDASFGQPPFGHAPFGRPPIGQ